MRVVVVPHDPSWVAAFGKAAGEATPAFGNNLLAIHHIGSTSIPGIHAKPIIDMLAVVSDIALVDRCNDGLARLGYIAKGEFGILGRRSFYRNSDTGVRTHQIHTFEKDSSGVNRHLAFRDFLVAHPEIASSYSDLKRRLVEAHSDDIEAYMDGKDAFIKEAEAKALVWAADRNGAAA
jgi:GrpB-like predicted nucleotidyltransferase (UPF0157 family)